MDELTNYNQLQPKKWYIDKNKADIIKSLLKNKMHDILIDIILNKCYDISEKLSYLSLYDNHDIFLVSGHLMDIPIFKIIIQPVNFQYYHLQFSNIIKCKILWSNNDHFENNNLIYIDIQKIICERVSTTTNIKEYVRCRNHYYYQDFGYLYFQKVCSKPF